VTAAEDAFGSSIGGEDIGLYSATDVCGFSPIDAGNVRLEATNVFNHYAWEVDSGGGLTYSAPRQLSAKLTVDL
jgi:hypothetical protein